MTRWRAILVYLVVGAALTAGDLWSKRVVFDFLGARLEPVDSGDPRFAQGREHSIIDGWLSLEAAYNLGAFNGSFASVPWLLMAISIGAVLVTFAVVLCPSRSPPVMPWALGLLAAGALGNLWDRFTYGAVRDFVKIYHFGYTWPNFNLADSAICTGVGLLFLREFILWRRAKRARAAQPPAAAPTEPPPAP